MMYRFHVEFWTHGYMGRWDGGRERSPEEIREIAEKFARTFGYVAVQYILPNGNTMRFEQVLKGEEILFP